MIVGPMSLRCLLHARTMGYHTVYTDHSLFGFADAACIHVSISANSASWTTDAGSRVGGSGVDTRGQQAFEVLLDQCWATWQKYSCSPEENMCKLVFNPFLGSMSIFPGTASAYLTPTVTGLHLYLQQRQTGFGATNSNTVKASTRFI